MTMMSSWHDDHALLTLLTVPHFINVGTPVSCSLGCFRNTFSGSFQLYKRP